MRLLVVASLSTGINWSRNSESEGARMICHGRDGQVTGTDVEGLGGVYLAAIGTDEPERQPNRNHPRFGVSSASWIAGISATAVA